MNRLLRWRAIALEFQSPAVVRSRGLVYELKPYAAGTYLVPAPSRELVSENQEFWRIAGEQEFPRIARTIKPRAESISSAPLDRLVAKLRLKDEPDVRTKVAGMFYSRSLNNWGLELQKAGSYPQAANCFKQAVELNPNNLTAQLNQTVNRDLQAGRKPVFQTSKAIEDKFGAFRKWDQILQEDGPIDEPGMCYQLGTTFSQTGLFRQGAQQFSRVDALAPDSNARYWLPQLFVHVGDFSNALSSAEHILAHAQDDPYGLFYKGVASIQLHDYQTAIPPLSRLLTIQTTNSAAKLNRAIAYLQMTNFAAARQDYESVVETTPKVFQAYFGLAEIASREKNIPEVIKNYQLYLTNAPPDSDEFKTVSAKLKELQPVATDKP